MDVKRIYFGNWLRDYSQAIDTGALKYVEAEAVRILVSFYHILVRVGGGLGLGC